MDTPFTGGCACGAVRYTCTSAPLAMLNCHCRDCQVSSGAPFASGFIVMADSVEVTGVPSTHVVTAASGNRTIRSFCGVCGTPLFTRGEGMPVMSIRFSSLDDPANFRPTLDIWTCRAQAWSCLDPDNTRFDTVPRAATASSPAADA